MFYNIQRTGTQTTKYSNHIKKELTIAKRFFSIVITDSLCWIPIFILKILSLMEVEIPGKWFAESLKSLQPILKDKTSILFCLLDLLFFLSFSFSFAIISFNIEKVKGIQQVSCACNIKSHSLVKRSVVDNTIHRSHLNTFSILKHLQAFHPHFMQQLLGELVSLYGLCSGVFITFGALCKVSSLWPPLSHNKKNL